MVSTYRFYTRSGELVCQGTAEECAEQMGVTVSAVRNYVSRLPRPGRKYDVEVIQPQGEKELEKKHRDAAKEWDDFITPIREKYGIPVYKGDVIHE